MPSLAPQPAENHIKYLDSARGIAALMVVGAHFIDRKFRGQAIASYLTMIFNGNDAVSFFFVLSGFVLSYKYIVLKKPLELNKFYVSRLFRLWPAYFITVLINCLYRFYMADLLTMEKLGSIFIFNNEKFWEEALLFRISSNYYFPGWTLTIETVGSFFLPFFIVIAVKNKKLVGYFILAFVLAAGQNFFFSAHFLLGVLVSCYYTQINETVFRTKKWFRYRYLIILAAIVLFSIRQIDALSPLGPSYKVLASYVGIDFFLYTGLASFVFLVAIIYSRKAQRFLEAKPLIYIGKISFCIYLVHPMAISLVYDFIQKPMQTTDPNIVFTIMTVAYIILTFFFAWVMHRFVELPFMNIGRKFVSKMRPSIVIGQ